MLNLYRSVSNNDTIIGSNFILFLPRFEKIITSENVSIRGFQKLLFFSSYFTFFFLFLLNAPPKQKAPTATAIIKIYCAVELSNSVKNAIFSTSLSKRYRNPNYGFNRGLPVPRIRPSSQYRTLPSVRLHGIRNLQSRT